MKGLILKDMYIIAGQGKSFIPVIFFLAIFGIALNNPSYFISLTMVMVMTMTLSYFTWDEYAKWDRYQTALPVTPAKVVLARYSSCGLLFAFGLVLSAVSAAVMSVVHPESFDVMEILIVFGVSFAVVIMILSITLPVVYRVGVMKARILMMLLIMVPVAGIVLGGTMFQDKAEAALTVFQNTDVQNGVLIGLPVLVVVLLIGSILLSIRFERRKYQ